MSPGADRQVALLASDLGLAVVAHADVSAKGPLAEDVEPAAQRVDGNADLVEHLFDVNLLPVVVVVGVRQPVFVELIVAADALLHFVEREAPDHIVVADSLWAAWHRVGPDVLHDARVLPHRPPAEVEREPPCAVEGDPVVVEAGGGYQGEHGHEVRGRGHRRAPLDVAAIGVPLHSYLAV